MKAPRSAPRGHRSLRAAAASVVVVVVAMVGVSSSIAAPFEVDRATVGVALATAGTTSEKGLHVYAISGRRYGIATAIHVLTFSRSHYQVKIGLAHHGLDRGEQTPSSMCRTTANCVAAVNGDFFNMAPAHQPDPGDAVGGIIQNCVLIHTPEIAHQQADLEGQSVSQGLNWSDNVDVNGVIVSITAINQQPPSTDANVHLPLVGTLLFTPPYALRIPSAARRITYEFTQVDGSASPATINTTTRLRLVAKTARAVKVTAGHVDISAPWESPFANLLVGATATMTTTSIAGCDNIGGHPILLDHGVIAPVAPADRYMLRRYARTVIGWTASRETVIMTVDGRDGVSGATASQLVSLLRSLKVVTALDLDGGNSTTFYAEGHVLNHPSLGTERPVSTGLLIVRNPQSRP